MAGDKPQNDQDAEWAGTEPDPHPPWSQAAQVAAAVLWPSFLAAGLATMLFFAFVDPLLIHEVTSPPLEVDRMTGYGLGFLFFWFVTALSSGVSVYLLRTGPGRAP